MVQSLKYIGLISLIFHISWFAHDDSLLCADDIINSHPDDNHYAGQDFLSMLTEEESNMNIASTLKILESKQNMSMTFPFKHWISCSLTIPCKMLLLGQYNSIVPFKTRFSMMKKRSKSSKRSLMLQWQR